MLPMRGRDCKFHFATWTMKNSLWIERTRDCKFHFALDKVNHADWGSTWSSCRMHNIHVTHWARATCMCAPLESALLCKSRCESTQIHAEYYGVHHDAARRDVWKYSTEPAISDSLRSILMPHVPKWIRLNVDWRCTYSAFNIHVYTLCNSMQNMFVNCFRKRSWEELPQWSTYNFGWGKTHESRR